ncbi:DUF453-domain-containing protein [Acaromyces ingoldii]|uniref:DUF453-domain-containing protein n=1 Tax=Acaromyces ingoldii TaxID=215250 RepID=A0A316YLH8_9BASI|nr:DUF453-domain-containing protein [Acaromyces ingoldii]PWN89916.1 DUF453-domain-containing protein [Acaromyces ingoldii]
MPLPRQIPAVFYRGGTSRGLLFKDSHLACYDAKTRDRILCAAMGSPDPDGRQIDGLGGGASSLSKIAVVSPSSPSSFADQARRLGHAFAGVDAQWSAEGGEDRAAKISDVVYRFGQVPINDGTNVDWGSTCGNMVAAVAHFAVQEQLLKASSGEAEVASEKGTLPVRILAHDSGKVVRAHVPVLQHDGRWLPAAEGQAQISGVPGTHPGILIESPLEGSVLSTGNALDHVEVDGETIPISIVDTGLPVIFVSALDLSIPLSDLVQHPAAIDSNRALMDRLERIRFQASQLTPDLASKFSPPAPKICVVHPAASYKTTGGQEVTADETDLLARTVSVHQLHRTIPATTLSALAAARCFADSVVSRTVSPALSPMTKKATEEAGGGDDVRAITIGQPAGASSASVQTDEGGQPRAIVMLRTARRIMQGEVLVPGDCLPHPDLASLDHYR